MPSGVCRGGAISTGSCPGQIGVFGATMVLAGLDGIPADDIVPPSGCLRRFWGGKRCLHFEQVVQRIDIGHVIHGEQLQPCRFALQ